MGPGWRLYRTPSCPIIPPCAHVRLTCFPSESEAASSPWTQPPPAGATDAEMDNPVLSQKSVVLSLTPEEKDTKVQARQRLRFRSGRVSSIVS